jgi:hypothetical protein
MNSETPKTPRHPIRNYLTPTYFCLDKTGDRVPSHSVRQERVKSFKGWGQFLKHLNEGMMFRLW